MSFKVHIGQKRLDSKSKLKYYIHAFKLLSGQKYLFKYLVTTIKHIVLLQKSDSTRLALATIALLEVTPRSDSREENLDAKRLIDGCQAFHMVPRVVTLPLIVHLVPSTRNRTMGCGGTNKTPFIGEKETQTALEKLYLIYSYLYMHINSCFSCS